MTVIIDDDTEVFPGHQKEFDDFLDNEINKGKNDISLFIYLCKITQESEPFSKLVNSFSEDDADVETILIAGIELGFKLALTTGAKDGNI